MFNESCKRNTKKKYDEHNTVVLLFYVDVFPFHVLVVFRGLLRLKYGLQSRQKNLAKSLVKSLSKSNSPFLNKKLVDKTLDTEVLYVCLTCHWFSSFSHRFPSPKLKQIQTLAKNYMFLIQNSECKKMAKRPSKWRQ